MQGNARAIAGDLTPRSLVWATDIDVLATDKTVLRRDGYWVVRSPSNPEHFWGNWLIFDHAPALGDGPRWQTRFAAEFPELEHCTLAWDVTDGSVGAAASEFPGFELEEVVGLVARAGDLKAYPRANHEVGVRVLSQHDSAWETVFELWDQRNAEREKPLPADGYRRWAQTRLAELRSLFAAGRGAWFVAEQDGMRVGSLGVVVTDGRARYQSVDTRRSHRRQGIASRLLFEAAERVVATWPVKSLVIAAEPDYHALGIYESLGFRPVERVAGVCRWPDRIAP